MIKIKLIRIVSILICALLVLRIDCSAYTFNNAKDYYESSFEHTQGIDKDELFELIRKYKDFFLYYIRIGSLPIGAGLYEDKTLKPLPDGWYKVTGDIQTLEQLTEALNDIFTYECSKRIIAEYFNNNQEHSNYKISNDNRIYTRGGECGMSPDIFYDYEDMTGRVISYSEKEETLTFEIFYRVIQHGALENIDDINYIKETYEFRKAKPDGMDFGWRIDNYEQPAKVPQNQLRRKYEFKDYLINKDMVYMVARDNETNWPDILWRFDSKGNSKKIYEGEVYDFIVSEDNSSIAIDSDKLILIDHNRSITKKLDKRDICMCEQDIYMNLVGWESKDDIVWVSNNKTWKVDEFIQIDTKTWVISRFENSLPFQREYDLDVDTGWIVYSDYPITFDVDSEDKFIRSNKLVTLWVHNYFTHETIKIDSANINRFMPRWLGKGTGKLEYSIGDKTYTYELPQGKVKTSNTVK